jgi:hypothetical protein
VELSGSSIPSGGTPAYLWTFESEPEDSELLVLDDADTAMPTFTPDAPGDYVVKLVVTSDFGSAEDTVLVHVIGPHDVTSTTEKTVAKRRSYLDRPTKKLITTEEVSLTRMGNEALTDVELRVVVNVSSPVGGSPTLVEMLPTPGWSYKTTTNPKYPGGYFSKVLGNMPNKLDVFVDAPKFSYGTSVRFTYALEVWGTY